MYLSKLHTRLVAFALCFVLIFTSVFAPIRSKALVPALPAIPVAAARTMTFFGTIMASLNMIDAAGGAFESIFGSSVYEFWKENFTDEDSYNSFTSSLNSTSASGGIRTNSFTGLTSERTRYYNFMSNLRDMGFPFFSMLRLCGVNEKAIILGGDDDDFHGFYFDEYGQLITARFANPFGVFNSSFCTLWNLDSLTLLNTYSPNSNYSVYYDYASAISSPNYLTRDCAYIDWDACGEFLSGSVNQYSFEIMVHTKPAQDAFFSVDASPILYYNGYDSTSGDFTRLHYLYCLTSFSLSDSFMVFQPNGTDETTRPTSVMDVISKWNTDNSIGTNPININYYISPTGQDVTSDNLSNPSLYDEETMVFTDPVTGNQYLTSGWTYDYLTRCYTLDMADTFTIGESVIDTIKLTYGDDKLTIDHYSNGSLVQSDSYDYVMVSGSECGLNGHSYTYETIKQESCTSTGERKYTCSVCGDEYAETVPATEHPFTYTVAKPATCLSTGMGIYTCPDCGLQSTETIPKSGHSSVVVEVVPSEYDENGALISAGYTLYECTECGSQYTESEDVGVENESWFSWLGSLFKTLLSSIVNGLAAGLEWVIEEVLVTTVGWIIKAVEWVFGLFNGEHLTTLFNWFSFEHEAWANEFSDPALFKEVA